MPFHSLKTGPFLSFFMIACLQCNKYLSLSHGSVQLFLLLVVLVFYLVLLIILNHSLSLEFCHLIFLPVIVLFGLYVLYCSCYNFILILFICFLLCFLLLITYVVLICFLFLFFFACISFCCSCCCGSCVCSSSCSSFVSSSLPTPAALEKENNGTKKQASHFVCLWGIFAKMSSQKSLFVFLWWIVCVHKTCLFDFVVYFLRKQGILCCFLFVVVLLFWCLETLFRSNVSLRDCILWIVFFFCSVRALLIFVFLFVCFGGSGLFLFNSLRHLGIAFSSWFCPHVASCTSCLGPSFFRAGLRPSFYGDRLGGSFGYGHEGGFNIFFCFSHNRGVWVKAGGYAFEGEGSYDGFVASKYCIIGVKKDDRFNFSQQTLQNLGFQRHTCASNK